MKGCLARTFGGEISRVPGTVIKDTCLTVHIVPLGYNWIIKLTQKTSHILLAEYKSLMWEAGYRSFFRQKEIRAEGACFY